MSTEFSAAFTRRGDGIALGAGNTVTSMSSPVMGPMAELDRVVDDNSNWVEFTGASTSGPRLANIPLGRPLGESIQTRQFG